MTSSKPGDESRTEIIHDVDYPLDVPSSSGGTGEASPRRSSDTATTAMPAAAHHDDATGPGSDTSTPAFGTDTGGYDTAAPLPFDEQPSRFEPVAPRDEVSRRGTTDLGLFLLRLVVGVLLALRGLQKLFGLFGGPGIDGFARILTDAGFDQARTLAVAGGAVELVAGVMLVVGLATPVAAAGLLGLVSLGIAIRLTGGDPVPLLGDTTRGLEPSALYATALVTLLFAGPGRWSADRRWRWSHRPRFSGFVWLLVAALAAVAVWYLLNGTNPLTSNVDSTPVTAGG